MPYILEQREVTRLEPVITGATCDNCNADLPPATGLNKDGSWSSEAPRNGLNITVSGGYGMWSDEKDAVIVLCDKCIDKLWRSFPAFQKALGIQVEAGAR
jgi:hypothetical protein